MIHIDKLFTKNAAIFHEKIGIVIFYFTWALVVINDIQIVQKCVKTHIKRKMKVDVVNVLNELL